MKTNSKRSKTIKTHILIQGLLLVMTFTFSGIAQADSFASRDGRPKLCDDTGLDPIEGYAKDVQALAEKSCADLNTAHDSTTTCREALDECVARAENSFWETLGRYHQPDQCTVRYGHYYRCAPCTYHEVLTQLKIYVAQSEKIGIEEACHCGNGHVDAGESCDPQAASALPRNVQCTSQCTLIQVDPVLPPPSPETPDSGSTTVNPNGGQSPDVTHDSNGFVKLGSVSPELGGCSLSLSPYNTSLMMGAGVLLPLFIIGMIRTRKNDSI